MANTLKPIPRSLLKDSAIVKVCVEVDDWQNPTWQEYAVSNVHLQNTNEVKKTRDNTEVVLRSILFIDGSRSKPALNYDALMTQSEAAGKPLRVVVSNYAGAELGDFEVKVCDPVPDIPATRTHHIELGLV